MDKVRVPLSGIAPLNSEHACAKPVEEINSKDIFDRIEKVTPIPLVTSSRTLSTTLRRSPASHLSQRFHCSLYTDYC